MLNETKSRAIGSIQREGRLSGKTAVITGGADGMGRATALAFAEQGARLAIIDIQKDAGISKRMYRRRTR